MKKLHPLDICWDVFVILAGIAIPTVCSWLFLDEFPVQGPKSDTINRMSIGWLGAGTIGYTVSYISLLVGYPDSKKEYLSSWRGRPIRMLSIGGIWVLYLISLLFGPIGIVLFLRSGIKWIIDRRRRKQR